MKTVFSDAPAKPPRYFFGLSPWLILGVSVILGMAVIALTVEGTRREEESLTENFTSRGQALIWALEAGARTWMGARGDRRLLPQLIRETAKQPGIVYIAVTDARGVILSHSDESRIGETFPMDLPEGEKQAEQTSWRVRDGGGGKVFEVYGLFAPIQGNHHAFAEYQRGHGHGRRRRMAMAAERDAEALKSYVFVGLDYQPFHDAVADGTYRNAITALLVALLGCAGFVSLFWAYGYRRSRRMLMDTRALAGEVITSLPLGLLTCDPDGRAGMVNAAALALLGLPRERLLNQPLENVPGLDWKGMLDGPVRSGRAAEGEYVLNAADGRRVPVAAAVSRVTTEDGLPLGFLFILRDVGEMKCLQFEVEKTRRLTALGNLAAGVAHEIRNPLSSIKGLATYLSQRVPAGGPEADAAGTMIGEVNRLDRVVSELLDFARPASVARASHDVNDIVSGALRLARADVEAASVTVEFTPDPDIPPASVNRERLTQALLNLFLNAVQAMAPGGKLTVTVGAAGDAATFFIRVADTGIGMSDEVRASMFTPYFTTRAAGTGLGLAIVHQIVEGHGGKIGVKSAPGQGSEFTITLPL